MTHCRGNPRFNFHRYMIRALEDDFRTVVGISWYLWIFVILFLLLNINGWHTYFWIAFIPFIDMITFRDSCMVLVSEEEPRFEAYGFLKTNTWFEPKLLGSAEPIARVLAPPLACVQVMTKILLLLAVGTKLEHVIIQLAHEIAEKHVAVEGELVVQPSDSHFWFDRPQIVLFLIHFILFQNAFEIAFFFWILFQYGFYSCIMGKYVFVTPRLVIGVFIQVLCSYSTLPLYALVTQMGSHYKKSMFDDHVQACLIEWAEKVKKKKAQKAARDGSNHSTDDGFTIGSPMSVHGSKESPNGV